MMPVRFGLEFKINSEPVYSAKETAQTVRCNA